jgi:hypothetical protein
MKQDGCLKERLVRSGASKHYSQVTEGSTVKIESEIIGSVGSVLMISFTSRAILLMLSLTFLKSLVDLQIRGTMDLSPPAAFPDQWLSTSTGECNQSNLALEVNAAGMHISMTK